MKTMIKKAQPNDWKIIQKLNNEVFEHSKIFDKHLNLEWPFLKQGTEYYKIATSSDKYFSIIAEIDGKPVAYLVGKEKNYEYRNNKVGEIDNMGTSPKFRSKGIGSQLVNEFKKWCKSKGITYISACTYYESSRVIRFYKKQGLKPIDINLEGKI